VDYLEEWYHGSHFYQFNIKEIGRIGGRHTWQWPQKNGKTLFFLMNADSRHIPILED